MRNFWIFPTLVLTTLSFVFFSNEIFWPVVIFIALLVRVVCLKRKVVLYSTLLTVIFCGGIFFLASQKLQHPVKPDGINSAVFYPDKLRVNGDSLTGQLKHNGKWFRFNYRLKNQTEQKSWQQLSKVVSSKIQVEDIQPIKSTRNPGEFDFKKFSNRQNIFYSVKLTKIGKLKDYSARNLLDQIDITRVKFLIYLADLPPWLKIHAQSLLVGYNNRDESDLFQILSVLGIIHLFSLSGLHVLILVSLFKKITSLIYIPAEYAEDMLLVLLPIYGIFVGLKTGITRAIVLVIIAIILKKLRIKLSRLDVFSITVIVCLLINPFSLVEMGGQLSFILSGGLLYFGTSSNLIKSLKMNLLSLPIISYYTFQFNWLIFLMNIIFVPVFTYIILPTSLVSALFVHRFKSGWRLLDRAFGILYDFLDQLSGLKIFNVVLGRFPLIITLMLIILALLMIENKSDKKLFRYYFSIFLITFLMIKFPLFGSVSMIDVGQGDSLLITTPYNRKTILIDTGGNLSFPKAAWQESKTLDQAEKSTLPYLKLRGIDHLDEIFISHKDIDHVGNLATILNSFPVTRVNFGLGLDQNKRIKDIISDHPKVAFRFLKTGDNLKIGTTSWKILWPKEKRIGENGDSLTLLAKFDNYKWLFTGDLDTEGENQILKMTDFSIDYLKVGHHGSKTSTGMPLLKQTNPHVALISAGVNNRYGHPNKETIQRLDEQRIAHLNTADYGMITWYYYPLTHQKKLETYFKGEIIETK